jgi:hypothetical protein
MSLAVILPLPAVSPVSPITVNENNMTFYLNTKTVWNQTNYKASSAFKNIYDTLVYCAKHRQFEVTIDALDSNGTMLGGASFGHYDDPEDIREFMNSIAEADAAHVAFIFFDKNLFRQIKNRLKF